MKKCLTTFHQGSFQKIKAVSLNEFNSKQIKNHNEYNEKMEDNWVRLRPWLKACPTLSTLGCSGSEIISTAVFILSVVLFFRRWPGATSARARPDLRDSTVRSRGTAVGAVRVRTAGAVTHSWTGLSVNAHRGSLARPAR